MTVIHEYTATETRLMAAQWLLRRFITNGAVTDLAFDQQVCVLFETRGTVTMATGLLTGSGEYELAANVLRVRGMLFTDPAACLNSPCLESLVADALAGDFTIGITGDRLLLHNDDATLEFAAS